MTSTKHYLAATEYVVVGDLDIEVLQYVENLLLCLARSYIKAMTFRNLGLQLQKKKKHTCICNYSDVLPEYCEAYRCSNKTELTIL